jgi:hypothetical protein
MEKEPKSFRHSSIGSVDSEADRRLLMGAEQKKHEEDELDWLTKEADQLKVIFPQGSSHVNPIGTSGEGSVIPLSKWKRTIGNTPLPVFQEKKRPRVFSHGTASYVQAAESGLDYPA